MNVITDIPNPLDIPEFLDDNQVEAWILFSIMVCGKEAESTWRKLRIFLEGIPADTPFDKVRCLIALGKLEYHLRVTRVGQYSRIVRAFTEAVEKLDVKNLSVGALESVHGIGPKSARMIMLYHKKDLEVVPLDTHVLKYLRSLGYEGVPKNTPPAGKTYAKWEKVFIEEAHKAKITVREFDTFVWRKYAVGFKKSGVARG